MDMRLPSAQKRCVILAELCVLASIGGVASACHSLTDPPLAPNSIEFAAPSVYADWWAMTEACSGISSPLSSVTWYAAPIASRLYLDGESVQGYWSAASDRIVLLDSARFDGTVVRHEMLHALLQVGGHPRSQFLGRCAGIVDCPRACVTTAEPLPPDAAGLVVSADSLDVWSEVYPAQPNVAKESGTFRITVFAHNRLNQAIVVDPTAGMPPGWIRSGFALMLTGTRGGVGTGWVLVDESTLRFVAGETKRVVFDFVVGPTLSDRSAPPDTYTAQGTFGQHVGADIGFTIAP